MKKLLEAFLDLPTSTGILLIVATAVALTIVALIVAHFSFRAGQRYAESRHSYFSTKRRELASIRL